MVALRGLETYKLPERVDTLGGPDVQIVILSDRLQAANEITLIVVHRCLCQLVPHIGVDLGGSFEVRHAAGWSLGPEKDGANERNDRKSRTKR